MRVERSEILPFRIPFRRPFRAGGREVHERSGLLIRLDDGAGHVGLGEVVARPGEPIAVVDAALVEAVRNAAVPATVRPGLECALLDLRARAAGLPLGALLGSVRRDRIPVNATLDRLDPREAAEDARRFVARGFTCIKVKVSPADLAGDEARLAAVRGAVGARVQLRIDANAAWTVEQSVKTISCLDRYGLDYVEQPVADIDGLAEVRRRVRAPIAADESVTGVAAVDALAAAGAADVVVVKPSLLGLRGSVDIAKRAAELGLGVVVTSTLDTSVGVAAAVHMAATLPDPLLPCGLATVELLAGDLVTEPLLARDGYVAVPQGPGLSVRLDDEAVARWERGTEKR